MANVAELAIKANTSGLEKVPTALNKVRVAAGQTASELQKLQKIQKQQELADIAAAKSATADAYAKLKRIKATEGATRAEISLAQQSYKNASANQAEAVQIRRKTEALMAFQKQAQVRTDLSKVSVAATSPNRFNTANIAAQFQDIGVTAAMGMNPLTIALQQGTQISAILNSMENPLRGIAAAFTSVINPVSLISIGFVALAAALIQVVNWTNVAYNSLTGLGDVFRTVGSNMDMVLGALTAGILSLIAFKAASYPVITALQLMFLNYTLLQKSIIATVVATALSGKAFLVNAAASVAAAGRTTVAWLIASSTVTFSFRQMIVSSLAAVVAFTRASVAATAAAGRIALVWAVSYAPLTILLGLIAVVVGSLIGFREDLKNLLGFDVLNAIKSGINSFIGFFFGAFEGLWEMAKETLARIKGESKRTLSEAFAEGYDKGLGRDYVGLIGEGIKIAGDKLMGVAENLSKTKIESPWQKLLEGAEKTLATLKAERDGINLTAEAASKLKYETQLLNEARDKGIKLGEMELSTISKLATQMASYEEQTRLLKAAKDFEESTNKKIETLKLEREAVGLSSEAAAILTFQTEALNDVREKGLKLSPLEIEAVKQRAAGMAVFSEGTRIYKENVEFARSTTSGFFRDLKSNIEQGKSLWESFGNTVTNVLNKILDKFLDLAVNIAFDSFKPSFGNIFSGLQGGGAKPIGKFAKGGTFTNNVVSKPTAFAYGGSFGVMGEAGPEAIMPLKRGSDGSLGVQLNGSSTPANSNVVVNIHNNSGATATSRQRQTSQGMEIDVMIDEIVSEKLTKEGSATNRSINMYNSRQLIKRG